MCGHREDAEDKNACIMKRRKSVFDPDRELSLEEFIPQLRDLEELSTQEASQILEISEDTVKQRLHRARLALRQILDPPRG